MNPLLSYALGVISGLVLALIAVIVGKKFETQISSPLVTGKAEIIKRKDVIDQITDENNTFRE